ncbi:MAG TPA: Flp family type IVb pilin [Paucimonas sp.]|nr:Flp family type IVb pilin [Paucimonas sp.]
MNKFFNAVNQSIHSFAKDEEGAQIVEYAMIIAVVSLGLILLMKPLTTADGAFQDWIDRVVNCLKGASTCV